MRRAAVRRMSADSSARGSGRGRPSGPLRASRVRRREGITGQRPGSRPLSWNADKSAMVLVALGSSGALSGARRRKSGPCFPRVGSGGGRRPTRRALRSFLGRLQPFVGLLGPGGAWYSSAVGKTGTTWWSAMSCSGSPWAAGAVLNGRWIPRIPTSAPRRQSGLSSEGCPAEDSHQDVVQVPQCLALSAEQGLQFAVGAGD
jgi:hypothetical protein